MEYQSFDFLSHTRVEKSRVLDMCPIKFIGYTLSWTLWPTLVIETSESKRFSRGTITRWI